ncbi:hypothetical protein EX30DRAFT_379628 [Ascodesmis nigricans]|uniref:UDENN FLCN/SMCR8-type domain-containing protein n=1 Tax=Ascodesmis nigricans TaxID=341454 RepID=A0A4S2MUM5_9PEZI|nr:hypothetical protein EX30DRAFT_379628 [Ascodesmis nigricans]
MDFIISLAHFCEDHGPTSILCTQVIPPSCPLCYPHTQLHPIARTPSNSSSSTPPPSSHGLNTYRARDGRSSENTPASSPRILSPSGTPPSSPRGGFSPQPVAPTSAAAADMGCKSCSITIPQKINAAGTTAPGGRDGKPRFRSTEGYPVSSNYFLDDGEIASSPTPSTHTHTITYLSCRAPSLAQRFYTVRQSCIRTLNCEVTPGPIMFGDHTLGYTIANVFKINDPKARGGRRTYAFLCMSPHQKALIQSWSLITATFQSMAAEINSAVLEALARENKCKPPPLSPTASVSSRGPEGFLRRRNIGDGNTQRSLAELTGMDDVFVVIHTKFVQLLSSLTKLYGFATTGYDSPLPPPAIGIDGRSRAGSITSVAGDDAPRFRRNPSPRGLEKEMRHRERGEIKSPLLSPKPISSHDLLRPDRPSGSSQPTPTPTNSANAATGLLGTPPKSPKEGMAQRRQVAVG